MPLLGTVMIVSGANAALVSFSKVITNNTLTEQVFELSKEWTLTDSLGNTGGSGSLAIVLTDIRGGGAYLKAAGTSPIYTSFINGTQVSLLNSGLLNVAPYGQTSLSKSYNFTNYNVSGNINQIIHTQLKFILSAGDQAVISSTFEVVSFVPTPGALAFIGIACGVGLRGRRRN